MAAEGTDGTLRFRLERLEAEQERQRERVHQLIAEQNEARLLLQHTSDQIDPIREDVRALKRAFYTFAISAVGSAVVFAFTIFALLGKP